jgi:Glycosyl transferases group 1
VSTDSSGQDRATLVDGNCASILLLSMRRLHKQVAFSTQYEFEDVFAQVTGADRAEADDRAALERSRRAYKLARLATGSRRMGWALCPRASTVRLGRDYDLFFAVFNNAYELFALATLPDWRAHCRKAACFINEIHIGDMPVYLLELLVDFDHVFIGVDGGVDAVARIVGRPVSYLPLAVDALGFAPSAGAPLRPIDICNIGRRSAVTHAALVDLARNRRIFYYYDTVAASGNDWKQRTFRVDSASEHRLLLASLLQRSRYFIANRGLVNHPEITRGWDIISNRFYEGAAAGTVMLGEPPRTEEFARQFDWSEAVIQLPFDSPDVGRVLEELDRDPHRLERIRRDNVRNAALRHDWVYRIRTVLETLGLPVTASMLAREAQLRVIADSGGQPAL